jgi:hypothetical protein
VECLHRWLARVDPPSAERILPRDRKRLVRALEVYIATGRPLTAHFAETASPIAELDGSWHLVEEEQGSVILIHQLRVRPGMPVPRIFVRATLRHDLPIVLESVKSRAESTMAAKAL